MELYRKERKFRIDERRLVLPKVGWVMEGDLNASINILGLRLIAYWMEHFWYMHKMVYMRRRAFLSGICQTEESYVIWLL